MATLREIKGRIRSIQNTQQITKAMKMVASAKMRRAQERMMNARPYADKIKEMVQDLSGSVEETELPLLKTRPIGRVILVAITGDRGLCGAFNSNIAKRTVKEIDAHRDREISVVPVGRKGFDFYKKREYSIANRYINFFNELEFEHAKNIAHFLIDQYAEEKTDAIQLVFHKFISVGRQEIVVDNLLPIEVEESESEQKADYLYEPTQKELLESLLPRYIRTRVWRSLLESYASEQAARMLAMDNATDNANELIKDLTLEYNKARQASITKEILDIVGGAEALRSAS